MTNAINYKDQNFQRTTVAVMNDILSSDINGSNMDDVYGAVCKYVKITKEQFNEYFDQAENKISQWKSDGLFEKEARELEEDELDIVVGGSFSSFLSSVGNGLWKAAKAVGNFVKEHAAAIGVIVGAAILCTGVGALAGAVVGGVVAAATGTAFGATCAAWAAVGAIFVGVQAAVLAPVVIGFECGTGFVSEALDKAF